MESAFCDVLWGPPNAGLHDMDRGSSTGTIRNSLQQRRWLSQLSMGAKFRWKDDMTI